MITNDKNHNPREAKGSIIPHSSVGKEASPNSGISSTARPGAAPNVLMPSAIPLMLPCRKTLMFSYTETLAGL